MTSRFVILSRLERMYLVRCVGPVGAGDVPDDQPAVAHEAQRLRERFLGARGQVAGERSKESLIRERAGLLYSLPF